MYAGLSTGLFMASTQLATAAILWTNNTGPPLESQLPWQFLSELLIHGLGLTVCGISPHRHSSSDYLPFSTNEITRYSVALLVTMTGRFLKAGKLDRRHKTHFQQWIFPIIFAVFATHHDDPELGGVLVILVAAVMGQTHMALERHSSVSDKTVRTGKGCCMQHTLRQRYNPCMFFIQADGADVYTPLCCVKHLLFVAISTMPSVNLQAFMLRYMC